MVRNRSQPACRWGSAGRQSSHPEFIAQTPMSGRPPSPSLAPPHSLRTRLIRQGAKNFCCAKLGPCRVFASLLALGQNLSGFRTTRQAKGAGREQTEVIMSNFGLQEKAVKAATRFIERKGFELLEAGWTSPEGTRIDLIANDGDTACNAVTASPFARATPSSLPGRIRTRSFP